MSPARIKHADRLSPDATADLPSLLKGYMERRGWTRARLADYLGTDTRTLCQWLAGRQPSKALCTALRLALTAPPHAEAMEHLARALAALQPVQRVPALKPATPPADKPLTEDEMEAAVEELVATTGMTPDALRAAIRAHSGG